MGGIPSLEEIEKNCREFRFVVLHHRLPYTQERKSHWDLMIESPLETAERLITFAIPVPPKDWKAPQTAQRLPDHRSLYLTYEGPISEQRGEVHRVVTGTACWLLFSKDKMQFQLHSTAPDWHAELILEQDGVDQSDNWRMTTLLSNGGQEHSNPTTEIDTDHDRES